jgi:hypothetical protein
MVLLGWSRTILSCSSSMYMSKAAESIMRLMVVCYLDEYGRSCSKRDLSVDYGAIVR